MGVISTNRAALPICDDVFPVDYLIESPITTDEESEHGQERHDAVSNYVMLSRRRRRQADHRRYPYFYQNIIGGQSGKQGVGARKQRRLENSRLLSALVDKEDIRDDLSDTLPETVSAFTQLFLEAGNMRAWNAFIHKTEEDQREFLRRCRRKSESAHKKLDKSLQFENQRAATGDIPSGSKGEKRHVHPAYSGSSCFRRIENRLKALLTHKHMPWEKLEEFEHDLTDYFTTSPDGVFVTVLQSGYERLLLHAVAQYLRLRSQSIGPMDHRETQIESYAGRPFTAPVQTLASYIRQHYGKPEAVGNLAFKETASSKANEKKCS